MQCEQESSILRICTEKEKKAAQSAFNRAFQDERRVLNVRRHQRSSACKHDISLAGHIQRQLCNEEGRRRRTHLSSTLQRHHRNPFHRLQILRITEFHVQIPYSTDQMNPARMRSRVSVRIRLVDRGSAFAYFSISVGLTQSMAVRGSEGLAGGTIIDGRGQSTQFGFYKCSGCQLLIRTSMSREM